MIKHNVQQGTEEWLRLRLGKITSSRVKNILKSTNMNVIDELIDESLEDYDLDLDGFVSEDMQWGIDYEPIAREEYERLKDVTVVQVGFCTHDSLPYLGLSPDGFVGDNDEGAVEIKCPRRKTHIRYVRQGGVPSDYWEQILQYFLVNENQQWVDFISYHPNFSPKPLYIHRTNRKDVETELLVMKSKVTQFWAKFQKHYNEITGI